MMMMRVPPDHFGRPLQRKLIDEWRRLRPAVDVDIAAVAVAGADDGSFAIGKPQQCRFTFPHDDAVDPKFGQRGARRRGAVRPYRDQHGGEFPERKGQLLRDPQFRWRASPEQIGGSGRDHDNVGLERSQLRSNVGVGKTEHVRVEQQRLVPRPIEQLLRDTEFERKMRGAATEIDAALVFPIRVE